jgi:3-oxoadipate enol-lactonase
MPVALAHRVDGPPDGPVVVLAPSLGTTWEMWDQEAEALAGTYRVVRFDTRGHGRSPVPPGPYTVDDMAADVLALADSLDLETFAFVGLSLGGAIGQLVALTAPDRLSAAVICCAVPRFGDPAGWVERAELVRSSGMSVLAEPTKGRWFTRAFRAGHPDQVDRFIDMITGVDAEGYASCCEALAGFDVRDRLGEITTPTRVVAGSDDPVATVPACGRMAAAIPGADLVVIDEASHIVSAERPEEFHRAVAEHLEKHL